MKNKEPIYAIDILLCVVKIIIEKNSIKLFEASIELMGDLFMCCQESANAINMYSIQNHLGDLTANYIFKIRAYTNLGQIMKVHGKLDQALKFYKKALEYAWFVGDEETETTLYERIGIVYFLLSNFEKALYYH